MVVKCGNCGKDFVVADGLQDGQHVLCPFCGEKTAYSRPKRIELPTGFVRPKASERSAEEKLPPPPPDEPAKPVLKLNREAGRIAREAIDPGREKRIYMAEEHVRFYEEMKTKEERRKAVGKITSLVSLVVLIGGGWAGYVLWTNHREHQEATRLAQQAERLRIEKERAAENERQEVARLEIERAERERREKEQAEAKAKAEAEKARRENEIRANKQQFFDAAAVFAESDLQFVSALPSNAVPGKVEGRFVYLVPSIAEEADKLVVCESSPAGVTNLFLLGEQGEKTKLPDADGFFGRLGSSDYLVSFGESVYFHSKRQKPHIGELKKDEPMDLTKEFFGLVEPKVRCFDCGFDNLTFELVFIPENSRKIIICDVIPFGRPYALERVREAVEDAYPYRAASVLRTKSKDRFRRTVVFWDGAHIKKGVDGVTYVSRVPPPASYDDGGYVSSDLRGGYRIIRPFSNSRNYRRAEQTRDYWESLKREAEKQDAQEAEFYRARGEAARTASDSRQDKALAAYREKIDRIIEKGKLYFRAKVK